MRLGGVGLMNLMVIALFTMLMIIGTKVVLNKYPVDGLTDMANAI